jgi:hypothetical protein
VQLYSCLIGKDGATWLIRVLDKDNATWLLDIIRVRDKDAVTWLLDENWYY